jgi:hypothetical protein
MLDAGTGSLKASTDRRQPQGVEGRNRSDGQRLAARLSLGSEDPSLESPPRIA